MKEISINVRFVKESIRNGATWEDMAKRYNCHIITVQRKVKESYSSATCYNKLLAQARANARIRNKAPEVLTSIEEIKEVIVTETGYLMKAGMNGILSESLDIIIPRFCMAELDKLARSHSVASEILQLIWSTNRITQLKLTEEVLFEEPQYEMKKRTCGIVAVCCELFATGHKVRLLTSSYEVAALTKTQGLGSDVKVELVQ